MKMMHKYFLDDSLKGSCPRNRNVKYIVPKNACTNTSRLDGRHEIYVTMYI
ncbi:hypothetical protein Hanom_Chr09g00863531 [Helianthus anomalus]